MAADAASCQGVFSNTPGAASRANAAETARIIAPARPGVLQTKWLARVEVLS